MHELLACYSVLPSSPNYEKQIGAMTQSMSIPLFSISLPACKLLSFPKKYLLQNIPLRLIACLYRATAHSLTPTERKAETKTNIFRPQITISSVLLATSSHHRFLIMHG